MKRILTLGICMFLLQMYSAAQKKPKETDERLDIKFGKISPADFDLSKYKFDSGAAAVVIADIGSTEFEGNSKGGFTLIFKRLTRIKILRKTAFDKAAAEEIRLYTNGTDPEKVEDIKGYTHSLENGQVVSTPLDDKSIFTEKITEHWFHKKFTLPALKENCIIEFTYTIKSLYDFNLRPWEFQGDYPALWSEYEVKIPQFFNYVYLTKGDQKYYIQKAKQTASFYSVRESGGSYADKVYSVTANVIDSRWVMKDVAPLKEEPFTTTLDNHRSAIEFQLHYIQFGETAERHDIMGTWYLASKKLLERDDFGQNLDSYNGWMTDDINAITAGAVSDEDKMRNIYAFVRDNFTCTVHRGCYTQNSLKTVYKTKKGTVAEINLVLVALMRHAGLRADPALLSTRENGYSNETYPLVNQFNYVICIAYSNDKPYMLDASWPMLTFGKMHLSCYNGQVRAINEQKPVIYQLDADSLREQQLTSVIIISDDKGHLSGSYQSTPGYYHSYDIREKIKSEGEKEYFKDIQTKWGSDMAISNTGIDSMDKYEYPVKVHYDFELKSLDQQDVLYFNPMMGEAENTNPFKALERRYPVEMPYTFDDVYTLTMDIPTGYKVDELPKSAKVAFNGTEGLFEYLVQQNETNIQLRSRVKLNKSFYSPEDYPTLRDFFAYIVKKQSEQIVFKKIK